MVLTTELIIKIVEILFENGIKSIARDDLEEINKWLSKEAKLGDNTAENVKDEFQKILKSQEKEFGEGY